MWSTIGLVLSIIGAGVAFMAKKDDEKKMNETIEKKVAEALSKKD